MKRFMFVAKKQDEDGYGTTITDEISSMVGIKGWFEKGNREEDLELIKWSRSAEIGDYHHHREGVAIRIKDFVWEKDPVFIKPVSRLCDFLTRIFNKEKTNG